MQDVKIIPPNYALGYAPQGSFMAQIERAHTIAGPVLSTNKPMKIAPISSREWGEILNGGYE